MAGAEFAGGHGIGLYVESLDLNRKDVSLRPATSVGATGPAGGWQAITFWNPTEGFENNNGFAIRTGDSTDNTYIGRPRENARLANGDVVASQVPFGGAGNQEWVATAAYDDICNRAYTNLVSMNRCQRGLAGAAGTALATTFWSRSIDDVAVRSEDNSSATFSFCDISAQSGFGGGAMLLGASNATSMIGCNIHNTWSGGQQSDGAAVHAVTITGGNPMFAGCSVFSNNGGSGGIINQVGGLSSWAGCTIGGAAAAQGNNSPVSDGIYNASGGAQPHFNSCTFSRNTSRLGTVYMDSSSNADDDHMLFSNCIFDNNATIDAQWGAVIHCDDDAAGRDPLCVFDRCSWNNPGNNGGTQSGAAAYEHDVRSNYFPRYRILRDVSIGVIEADTQAAGVANADDGNVDGNGADINGDGTVNGADLAILLGAWN
jgi:hypothetical protein